MKIRSLFTAESCFPRHLTRRAASLVPVYLSTPDEPPIYHRTWKPNKHLPGSLLLPASHHCSAEKVPIFLFSSTNLPAILAIFIVSHFSQMLLFVIFCFFFHGAVRSFWLSNDQVTYILGCLDRLVCWLLIFSLHFSPYWIISKRDITH